MRWIGAMLLVASAACGPRAMLASTTPTTGSDADTDTDTDTDTGSGTDTGSVTDTASVTGTGTATASASDPGGIVFSRLPAPHRLDAALIVPPRTLGAARALVGRRDKRPALTVALDLSSALTDAPRLTVRSEAELVGFAQDRHLWKSVPAIQPGDLLIFDRAVDGKPASLVAVALARDSRGVVEMLYLARGVVRRGFFDPSRPKTARDRERRVVNTYLRHGADQPPRGTRFLAGELFAGVIAADPR